MPFRDACAGKSALTPDEAADRPWVVVHILPVRRCIPVFHNYATSVLDAPRAVYVPDGWHLSFYRHDLWGGGRHEVLRPVMRPRTSTQTATRVFKHTSRCLFRQTGSARCSVLGLSQVHNGAIYTARPPTGPPLPAEAGSHPSQLRHTDEQGSQISTYCAVEKQGWGPGTRFNGPPRPSPHRLQARAEKLTQAMRCLGKNDLDESRTGSKHCTTARG
ncbi:hypothetical protein VTI28DRAFT_5670 [Corynascus sepedonium]